MGKANVQPVYHVTSSCLRPPLASFHEQRKYAAGSSIEIIGYDIILNYLKNKLYISDSDNYSIREYNIRDRELKTIAGYYPFNKIDKIPVNEIRKYGTEIGNGYDARFNNVQDIIYATLNNIEYLIVNDYNTNTSSYRFLIIHLDTYFVSLKLNKSTMFV